MVDRGGLFHISDEAYDFFHCMEMLVRRVFHKENVENINPRSHLLLHDEDVTFTWYNLMEEMSLNAKKLLKRVLANFFTQEAVDSRLREEVGCHVNKGPN